MSAAELLKKMQKVREERALRASNATEQAVKVESTRLSETEKQEQESRSLHNEQVIKHSQGEADTVSSQINNNNNQKQQISEETLLMKKTGQSSNTLSKKIDEEEDLMLNVPPSFTSPAHAIPQYRNRTSDPLCTPFHADLAANMFLHELICQNVDAGALQQNDDNVNISVEYSNDDSNGAHHTEIFNESSNNIISKQLPLLSTLNRKRARTCEQEQNDQMQEPALNTHLNHINTSRQDTTNVFDSNVLDCIRFLNSSCSMSSTSSSITTNYFSPYLTHKLNVVHHITSPLECTFSKFSLRESQRHLHSHLDNNDNNYNFHEQRQSEVCISQQEQTIFQQGSDKNICNQNEESTGMGKSESKQNEIKHLECKSLDNNSQLGVRNEDQKLLWMSLYEDSKYTRDCQRASVHTHNLHAYPCGDVNRYVRKDFIAHGVYGVVFSASKKVLEANTKQNYESALEQKANSFTPGEYVTNDNGNHTRTKITNFADKTTHQKDQMELFAVKQIRKSRLAESREGFPTYLLREFDLLLRIRHPNIVEAQELVLLDPSPQLNLCHCCKTHKEKRVEANEEATRQKLLEEEEEHEEKEKELQHQREKEEEENEDEKAKEREAKNANSSVNIAAAAITELDKSKEAVSNINVVQTSSTSFQSLHHSSTKVRDVFLIMEYCPFDLKRYMFYYARNANPHLPPTPFLHISSHNHHPNATNALISRIKCVIYQILSGLHFLHDHRILHRDLKTSNILLDRNGRIKLCDFGLARHYREGQRLTPTVVTLLYRAPERHFGVMDYSHKLDSWSAGCIFAELFLKEPLFKAETDMGHLRSICDVVGIPSEESFPGLYKLPAAKEMMRSIGRWNRKNKLAQVFATSSCRDAASLPPSALDLLNKLLEWNPARRLSAKEALEHAFFSEFPPPCAPSELLTPMPTLYSSSNQRSATEQIESKINEIKNASVSTSISLSTFAKSKHNANVDSGDDSNKTNHTEFDNNTLTQSRTTATATANTSSEKSQVYTFNNINHNICNNTEEPCMYADDNKTFASYNANKLNKTAVKMETDEENDMYCSPVDAIHENSSCNASNSLQVNSALFTTNNNSDNTDPDSTNSRRHNGNDNDNDDDDDDDDGVAGIHEIKNMYNVWEQLELEKEKEKEHREFMEATHVQHNDLESQ